MLNPPLPPLLRKAAVWAWSCAWLLPPWGGLRLSVQPHPRTQAREVFGFICHGVTAAGAGCERFHLRGGRQTILAFLLRGAGWGQLTEGPHGTVLTSPGRDVLPCGLGG